MKKIMYSNHEENFFEVYQKENSNGQWILLIHGGYWRQKFSKKLMEPLVETFLNEGFNVVNIEYCRGEHRWPIPFEDIKQAIKTFKETDYYKSKDEIILLGHSVGGQLALLNENSVDRVIALAPVTDVLFTKSKGLGDNAVVEYFGNTNDANLEKASPIHKDGYNSKILIVHGLNDQSVLIDTTLNFVNKYKQNTIYLFSFPFLSHKACIDPKNYCFQYILGWLNQD